MPFLVKLLPRAQRDLEAIYNFIEGSSSVAAHRWFNGLADAIASLENSPERNPRTTENPELRHLLYGHNPHIYRVIYSVDKSRDQVSIIHVRHGARNAFESSLQ